MEKRVLLVLVLFAGATFALQPKEHDELSQSQGHRPNPLEESANDFFDNALADLRRTILIRGLEPVHLPEDSDNFTATLFNSTMDGHVWVGQGEVTGLSSIHRTGNMTINPQRENVIEGRVGLTDLIGKYSSEFELGPFRSKFGAEFQISFMSLDITTGVYLVPSQIVLEECYIDHFSTLHFKLNGNIAYELLGNAFTQIFEPVVTEKIQTVICAILNDVINGAYETTTVPFHNDALGQFSMRLHSPPASQVDQESHQLISPKLLLDGSHNFTFSPFKFFQISWFG